MADFKINGKDFTYPASANTETKKAVYVVSQQVRNIAASQDEKTGNSMRLAKSYLSDSEIS